MTNRVATFLGTAALMAPLLVLLNCSSSSPATTGTGGTGAPGTGGSTTPGGSGGAGGAGSTDVMNPIMCASGIKNHAACTTGDPCWNTCGPVASGFKNCSCTGVEWSCPTCVFPSGRDYSCYHLPANLAACPADSTDPTGMNLPQSGAACNFATCAPCGSSIGFAYRDSSNVPKVGYCVCTASDGSGKLSCGSASEWPPQ